MARSAAARSALPAAATTSTVPSRSACAWLSGSVMKRTVTVSTRGLWSPVYRGLAVRVRWSSATKSVTVYGPVPSSRSGLVPAGRLNPEFQNRDIAARSPDLAVLTAEMNADFALRGILHSDRVRGHDVRGKSHLEHEFPVRDVPVEGERDRAGVGADLGSGPGVAQAGAGCAVEVHHILGEVRGEPPGTGVDVRCRVETRSVERAGIRGPGEQQVGGIHRRPVRPGHAVVDRVTHGERMRGQHAGSCRTRCPAPDCRAHRRS